MSCAIHLFQQGECYIPDGETPYVLQVLWQWRTNTNIAITTSQMDPSAPRLYLASTSLDYTYSITIKELIKQQCDRQWKSDHHI